MSEPQTPEKNAEPEQMVEFKVDGQTLTAPKGSNLLEALLDRGEDVSYFCYHPGLSIAACCRQCLVGVGGRMVPACQMQVQPDLEIESNSDVVLEARRAMLEYTLLNHPVDCVICDKAGECTLQRHYMDWDAKDARIDHGKVDKPKKVDLGPEIMLDAERCILCSRCIRFCAEVAQSPDLVFEQRGNHSTLTTAPGRRLDNAYSLNTVDICPVGALTDKDFRFRIRVWELYATRTVCHGCATGCPTEVHHRGGQIYRMVPPKRFDMNLNWMCDHGRRTYKAIREERIVQPQVGGSPAELDAALGVAATALRECRDADPSAIGVVLGADVTNEANFAAARLATLLGTERLYLAERPDSGKGDGILRVNDPNPNRAGAQACGGSALRSADDLAADVGAGKLKALYVVSDLLELSDEALGKLAELKVVVQASQPSRLTRKARVVLPAAKWAEDSGTVVNADGRVQRVRAAVEPPGMARPHLDLIARMSKLLGDTSDTHTPNEVFEAMKDKVTFFAEASWGRDIPTVMLRFAGRRG